MALEATVLQRLFLLHDQVVGALVDPDIGRALATIHARPDTEWTVASLAESVAMSRSAFAARFTALVGEPPLPYLAGHPMRKAAEMLHSGRAPIKEMADRVGYESEARCRTRSSGCMGWRREHLGGGSRRVADRSTR